MTDYIRTEIVMECIEVLQDGYPLDQELIDKLQEIGVDYNDFLREFEITPDIEID